MNELEKLHKLLSQLSYHRAAEGDDYFREGPARAKVEQELRALSEQHTAEEMQAMLGEPERPYLVDWERDVVRWCK